MAKIIKEVYVDINYTIELSQKELNTITHLIGRLTEGAYDNGMGAYVHKDKVLTYQELVDLHEALEGKTDYLK